jgi:hypothetical protein
MKETEEWISEEQNKTTENPEHSRVFEEEKVLERESKKGGPPHGRNMDAGL